MLAERLSPYLPLSSRAREGDDLASRSPPFPWLCGERGRGMGAFDNYLATRSCTRSIAGD